MKGTVCIKNRFTAFVILLHSLIRADGAVCNRAWTTVWSRRYYMQRHCRVTYKLSQTFSGRQSQYPNTTPQNLSTDLKDPLRQCCIIFVPHSSERPLIVLGLW